MTTYYYYPSTRSRYNTRNSASIFDRMTTSRTTRSVSPPGLSRASTPDSMGPSTPVLPSAFLHTSKMASKPQVGFTSPATTSAYRVPEWDERSVMRAFAQHASHCDDCNDHALRRRRTLCVTGTGLAKDIGKYFYCSDGKPYSQIDKKQRGERVQVEVPAEYHSVKVLFEALSAGINFSRPKRPEVHQSKSAPTQSLSRAPTVPYEIKPYTSNTRRQRSNTYTAYAPATEVRAPKYETRSPYDDRYRDQDEAPRRDNKRGSLYVSPERQSKRKSYVVPFTSGWVR